jgi:cyclase
MGCAVIKKRIIGVITVRNGIAVQSMGYRTYLPLGKPEILAENLARWGVDEILVLGIDRSKKNIGPDLHLIERIAKNSTGTPLIYGGGIRNSNEGIAVIKAGADRLCLEALNYNAPKEIIKLSNLLGSQALIRSLPLLKNFNNTYVLCGESKPIEANIFFGGKNYLELNFCYSELLLIDSMNDGFTGKFNEDLLTLVPEDVRPIIAFGGIGGGVKIDRILNLPSISAVAMGNSLNYQEISIKLVRKSLKYPFIRRE